MSPSADDSAEGHSRTAGGVLLGMALVAIVGRWVFHDLLGAEMGFIGPGAMTSIGVLYLGVGLWMVRSSWKDTTLQSHGS